MTVTQIRATMPASELVEWLAYDQLDPIGSRRSDIQTALLAKMQSASETAKIDDFILFDLHPKTDEELQQEQYERRVAEVNEQADRLIMGLKSQLEKQRNKVAE